MNRRAGAQRHAVPNDVSPASRLSNGAEHGRIGRIEPRRTELVPIWKAIDEGLSAIPAFLGMSRHLGDRSEGVGNEGADHGGTLPLRNDGLLGSSRHKR